MGIEKVGIHRPSYVIESSAIASGSNEETGMCVDVYDTTGGNGYALGVYHEDVGLTTWHRADTAEDAEWFVQRLESVQVESFLK